MATLPNMLGDVYFGDADAPLPDWRKEASVDREGEDEEATDEERAAVAAVLGFNPFEKKGKLPAKSSKKSSRWRAAPWRGLTQKSGTHHPCSACCSCPRCRSAVCVVQYRLDPVTITCKDARIDVGERIGLLHVNRKRDITTDDDKMTATCILATSDRDRQGDIIECGGVLFDDHQLNPVVLWDHGKWGGFPIGITEDGDENYTVRYLPDKDIILQTTHFAETPTARQVYALVRNRIVRANSIAVKDVLVDPLPPDPARGLFQRRDAEGRKIPFKHIKKSILAEVTWTSLPANPDAVMSILARGKIDGGGFNNEPLDGIIRKSLMQYVVRPRAWANGFTLESR